MCFAAMLGYETCGKKPLGDKTKELDSRPFSNSEQTVDIMCLLALCDSKSSEILREENEDDVVTIFEEYVQGGFEILQDWLNERPEDVDGEQAILAALSKNGFLKTERDPEKALGDVSF